MTSLRRSRARWRLRELSEALARAETRLIEARSALHSAAFSVQQDRVQMSFTRDLACGASSHSDYAKRAEAAAARHAKSEAVYTAADQALRRAVRHREGLLARAARL